MFPIPAVFNATPNALITGAKPDRAVLIPWPIPVAAVLIAVPVVLMTLASPLKIWVTTLLDFVAPFTTSSAPSLAPLANKPNGLKLFKKLNALKATRAPPIPVINPLQTSPLIDCDSFEIQLTIIEIAFTTWPAAAPTISHGIASPNFSARSKAASVKSLKA